MKVELGISEYRENYEEKTELVIREMRKLFHEYEIKYNEVPQEVLPKDVASSTQDSSTPCLRDEILVSI